MSLADRLNEARDSYTTKAQVCKLMSVTLSAAMSEVDVDALVKILNSNPGDAAHMPNARIAHALRAEGFDVSNSAVDRHRRKDCSCYRKVS